MNILNTHLHTVDSGTEQILQGMLVQIELTCIAREKRTLIKTKTHASSKTIILGHINEVIILQQAISVSCTQWASFVY